MSAPKNVTAYKLKTFDQLVRDKRLRGLPVCVAWRIIDRMNPDLTSWPSHALIAREIDCSERSVKRAVAILCKLGWLNKVEGGGRGRSNRYALKTFTGTDLSPFSKSGAEKAETVIRVSNNSDADCQETVIRVSPEPLKKPIYKSKGGHAASPPKGCVAPSKKKVGLQESGGVKTLPSLPATLPSLKAPDGISKTEMNEAIARSILADSLGWKVMMAADDLEDENHLSAMKTCRREAKRLGVIVMVGGRVLNS